jgi:hypothetical protein
MAHDHLIKCAILHGPEYNIKNGLVYDPPLQPLTINEPTWTWISMYHHTRDGRKAGKSLINYYLENSAKNKRKQECYNAISKAT